MLKIIGGEKKGRLIYSPKDIRPILSRIKKSLFDIIKSEILNAIILDLYAGSGAVGLEMLSRGAQYCIFVEKDRYCSKIIGQNIKLLNYENRCYVIVADVLKDLFWVEKTRRILSSLTRKNDTEIGFDIIFIGAPYVKKIINTSDEKKNVLTNFSSPTIKLLYYSNLLKNNKILIVQHSIKENVDYYKFTLFRQEKYGDTVLTFLTKSG